MTIEVFNIRSSSCLEPIIKDWEELLRVNCVTDDLLFGSPIWIRSIINALSENESIIIITVRKNNIFTGILSLYISDYYLKFAVKGKSLYSPKVKTAYVLGSKPLATDEASSLLLLEYLISNYTKSYYIYFDSLCVDDNVYGNICNLTKDRCIHYEPDGKRPLHFLKMPADFDSYMFGFSKKKKYNLNRQIKQIYNSNTHKETLVSYDTVGSLVEFIDIASIISESSWQRTTIGIRISKTHKTFTRWSFLAENNIFKSYVLNIDDKPVAFVVGYVYSKRFYYIEIGYNTSYKKYSPGTSLLHLIIKDIIDKNIAEIICFGVGDAQYKVEYGNVHKIDTTVILANKNIYNTILIDLHCMFRNCINMIKLIYESKTYGKYVYIIKSKINNITTRPNSGTTY